VGRLWMFMLLTIFAAVPASADTDSDLPQVRAAILQPTIWRVTEQVPAIVDAQQNAVLSAQRSGQVVAVLYKSGETVAAGSLLVRLDNAPEQAQLMLDQARLSQSQRALLRDVKLLQISGASQAQFEQAQADVAEAKAQVALDNAMLAQLNITAPFAGVVGIRKISEGDYVQQGQQVAQLTELGPLRVLFSVPQTEAGNLQRGDGFLLNVASLPGDAGTIAGRITALSPQVDTSTNARAVEGMLSGRSATLLPGMYGVATLQTGTPQPAFSLPATALNDDTLGRYVYVLDAGANQTYVARAVYVTEFTQNGDTAVVDAAGLTGGLRVVAIGGFKLSDGARVTLSTP
jgi:membrane fusion protein (multidrug efflux system)